MFLLLSEQDCEKALINASSLRKTQANAFSLEKTSSHPDFSGGMLPSYQPQEYGLNNLCIFGNL
jgi:hypothetical protein